MFSLSNPCVTRGRSFFDDFLVPRGSLRCWSHESPLEAISLMIYESTGADCTVESMCHPWKLFRWWFLRPQSCLRCRIHVSPVKGFFFMIYELTMTQFLLMFLGHRGWLRCRIHASHVEAVSLMISESTVVACVVETMSHPWKQFC